MCSQSRSSSRIALIIDAWMSGIETTNSSIIKIPQCETFSKTWKRINQPRISQEVLLFLSTNPNFWVRKYGAVSLVNETFENVHSLPSSRVTQRCPSSWPSQVGHPLLHHHPAQDLWLCHSEELPESLPYNSEDQKEEVSQQHWSCSAEIFLSTSRGSQDSHHIRWAVSFLTYSEEWV